MKTPVAGDASKMANAFRCRGSDHKFDGMPHWSRMNESTLGVHQFFRPDNFERSKRKMRRHASNSRCRFCRRLDRFLVLARERKGRLCPSSSRSPNNPSFYESPFLRFLAQLRPALTIFVFPLRFELPRNTKPSTRNHWFAARRERRSQRQSKVPMLSRRPLSL